jgi:hypothetical protein
VFGFARFAARSIGFRAHFCAEFAISPDLVVCTVYVIDRIDGSDMGYTSKSFACRVLRVTVFRRPSAQLPYLNLYLLTSRSTRNQRGNCTPILTTVHLHCILQLDVFVFCPFTRT